MANCKALTGSAVKGLSFITDFYPESCNV